MTQIEDISGQSICIEEVDSKRDRLQIPVGTLREGQDM
jgi:hypothetical protein